MGLKQKEQTGIFANILSDGTIRVKCEETTPGAVKRDWETKDGKSGTKYELVYQELSGIITDIVFHDGDYGKSLNITVTDNDENYILCMSLSSNYAEDVLKKLPNVELSKEVTFKPFSFIDDKTGKARKGVTISQGEEKIVNYFTTYDKETKITDYKFGFPKPDQSKKKFDSTDWKIYFMQCNKFLENFVEENIIPMFSKPATIEQIEACAQGDKLAGDPGSHFE